MKKTYNYNGLVRFYYRSRRKLKSLMGAGKNLRKQGVLEKRLVHLHRLLTNMQATLKAATATGAVATGLVLLQPTYRRCAEFHCTTDQPFQPYQ